MSELRTITSAEELDFGKLTDPQSGEGILPVVCIDESRLISLGLAAYLMQGYANFEAVAETLQSGRATFWSRSKQRLWTKGEQSGNFLLVTAAYSDCDMDSLLLNVEPQGPACHTGSRSCFEIPPKLA